ncbi:MAG: YlmC/YmxH family sporulation protein [Caloramator sp.]|nr:YlmC/YmxH family sporulation protein [Caloramator sp.]
MKNKDDKFITLSQLRQMEVIDVVSGKKLGFISDIIFDDGFNRIESIVLPPEGGIFSIFKKKEEIIIPWSSIKTLGIDVILIERQDEFSTGK